MPLYKLYKKVLRQLNRNVKLVNRKEQHTMGIGASQAYLLKLSIKPAESQTPGKIALNRSSFEKPKVEIPEGDESKLNYSNQEIPPEDLLALMDLLAQNAKNGFDFGK